MAANAVCAGSHTSRLLDTKRVTSPSSVPAMMFQIRANGRRAAVACAVPMVAVVRRALQSVRKCGGAWQEHSAKQRAQASAAAAVRHQLGGTPLPKPARVLSFPQPYGFSGLRLEVYEEGSIANPGRYSMKKSDEGRFSVRTNAIARASQRSS